MNSTIKHLQTSVFDQCYLKISNFRNEPESQEYGACQFEINKLKVISRISKITPKKVGQFVTFWKRNKKGITEPYNQTDHFDFYIITVKSDHNIGQFVFPKKELINQGIISTDKKDGKRGFRVYPSWDNVQNKQAEKTQKWQLKYFYEINEPTDSDKMKRLLGID